MDHGVSPPSFLGLAGHPVRWRLLCELAHSDRRVGELCSLIAEPQSLVSYHLGRLRAERVVLGRRSTADGRDTYYRLDLDRCRELIAGTGVALHPGLRFERAARRRAAGRGERAVRVLFVCTGNSARSQIAEALTQHLCAGAVDAVSAGSAPKPLHPHAVRVLAERGIDIAGRDSKHLDLFAGSRFGYVVTLCDRVREVCPEFPDHPHLIHWSVPDPSREAGADGDSYPAFQRTLAEVETRVGFLLELIGARRETAR
jgi:ArsR family transcriptional regulator, arsenate/arsenite/antimonite-responsive transcriptional repressor / arsenate reductase (thioredoxin)